MTYTKIKPYTGCLLPLVAFLGPAGLIFYGLWTSSTGFGWLTFVAPLALGLCAAIVVSLMVTPLNKYLCIREIKTGGPERIAAWVRLEPPLEFYIGGDGLWLNGQAHYWGGLHLNLQDVILDKNQDPWNIIIKLCRETEKRNYYFDVEVPVPDGKTLDAQRLVRELLDRNIVLDEKGGRKEG